MRSRVSFPMAAFTLLGSLFTHAALAQKFQEPTRDELQMTSDPKAPGAAAVYLNREIRTDNQSHFISEYARIKVLTESGKEWATVRLPYFSGGVDGAVRHLHEQVAGGSGEPIIEGRTIHSDGSVVPLVGSAEDLLVAGTSRGSIKVAMFTLPSVEVGSILEYRWTIPLVGTGRYDATLDANASTVSSALASSVPEWDLQSSLFTHKEHFYFNPFASIERSDLDHDLIYYADGEIAHYLLYTANLPAGAQVAKSPRNDYALDVRDIPPIPREQDAPPESAFLYHVHFYYTPYVEPQLFWTNEQSRLFKRVDQFAAESDGIRQAAAEITAGAATPDAKARKLYEAVQALDNTAFSRAKSSDERQHLGLSKEQRKVEDIWKEKSGSPNDLAALYLALARAAGLEAYAIKVADRSRRIFDPNVLSVSQMDSLLVALRIDGKEVLLDPGEKLCPYGQLHWRHMLAGGLQQNVKGPIFTPPNLSKDAIVAHSADLTLGEDGSVTGTVKVLMNGPQAMYWRQLGLTSDPAELEKQFTERMRRILPQGVEPTFDRFEGIGTSATNLLAVVKVSGQLASPSGKRLLVPAYFFSTRTHHQFVDEPTRSIPVDLHYTEQVIDDVIYHLPTGYSVEGAPPPVQLPWPQHAVLVTKTTSAPGVVDIKHIFARTFVLLDAKEYPALCDFYQKLATADQQQLVLTASASTAAN